MIPSFRFVKQRAEFSDAAFFARWTEHSRDFDLVDHAPTVVVTHEVDVAASGISHLFPPGA